MDAPSGKLIRQVVLPVALLVAIAMSVVVGFVWLSAQTQDRIALEQSIESVGAALNLNLERIGLVAKDVSVRRLARREWVDVDGAQVRRLRRSLARWPRPMGAGRRSG